jgi:hypothetical protein
LAKDSKVPFADSHVYFIECLLAGRERTLDVNDDATTFRTARFAAAGRRGAFGF